MRVPASQPEVEAGDHCGHKSLKPRLTPTTPEDSPQEWTARLKTTAVGCGVAAARGARVGTLPFPHPPRAGVAPRPATPTFGAPEALHPSPRSAPPGGSIGPQPSSRGGSPPPRRLQPRLRGLSPGPPVSRVKLSVTKPQALGRRGHSEMRLLLSFHFFLRLNVPACDYLQCPFLLGTPPIRPTPHSCTSHRPPSNCDGGAKERPVPGSWQRFRGLKGLRGDQRQGVAGDCGGGVGLGGGGVGR